MVVLRSGRESSSSGPIPKRKRSAASKSGVLRSGRESSSSGPIPKGKRSAASKSGVMRSGRVLSRPSFSSLAYKSKYASTDVPDEIYRKYQQAFPSLFRVYTEHPPNDAALKFALEALDYYNQHSSQKYKLLNLTAVTPVPRPICALTHINFTAINTDVAHAPEEMFFTELAHRGGLSIRLCVSLGPINTLSGGDRLNGCYYCREYNNVRHPKSGGFVRGGDAFYKSVQDISDINQNNAIANHEKPLPMFKQVFRSHEPKKEGEYISEQVDDESLYATEALKIYTQATHINYELVKPGSVTRVILPTCLLFHVNFKAKETDVATAPEEMFFAEMTTTSGVISCKGCTILAPSELISGDKTGDKTNGCYYCHEFNNVCHPDGGGFVRGGDSLYILEKELGVKGFRC